MKYKFQLSTLTDTTYLANNIAKCIVPNFVITLTGNLGSGKTTFVREALRSIGVKGIIKSPTYTLVEPYFINNVNIYHFDLYRFSSPDEWFDAGFDEYFLSTQISFIEWSEKATGLIPQIDWQIEILVLDESRELTITTVSEIGEKCLVNLINSGAIY